MAPRCFVCDSQLSQANGQEKYESLVGSRVLVIKNAAGAGDVDEELGPELKTECCKCGNVNDVVIWECSEDEMKTLPTFEHVRVFVLFDTIEEATLALEALNERFFAGRKLQVTFFKEEAFKEKRFAP
jgi:poly(U)-binding-splicing factor PUF60